MQYTLVRLAVLVATGCGDNLTVSDAQPDAAPPDAGASWRDLRLGGAEDDDALDLVIANDQLLVAGYRDGVIGANVEPEGAALGFVQAYGLDGALRWERTFDTAGADTVEAMHLGASDLVITGRTTGAFAGATNAGQMDAFVARFAADGSGAPTVLQFGDERPQHPARISRDTEGALLLAGFDDLYIVGGALQDNENSTVARVTTTGGLALAWQRRTTTAVADRYFALAAPGPAGEVIVGGNIAAGADKGAHVCRLAADGSVTWSRRLSTIGFDAVTALELGPDGNLYAAGATFQMIGDHSYGGQDLFVAVLDPVTGATLRAMQAGTGDADYARDLAVAADGTVYVAGETLGALPGGTARGSFDLAVVQFAPDGRWTGAWQRGTDGDETLRALALSPEGVFVAGYTQGDMLEGLPSLGRQDAFVLRIAPGSFATP